MGRKLIGQDRGAHINSNHFPNINVELHRVIISEPPMCALKDLQNGTYSIDDLQMMNELLDLKDYLISKSQQK